MKEFKVGDQVALYLNDARVTGKITEIDGWKIRVLWKHPSVGNVNGWHHVKQCRRLVKKKRREFWIKLGAYGIPGSYQPPQIYTLRPPNTDVDGYIHVREVKP